MILARQTPKNPKIHWENVTNISKTPTTPKKPIKKITDDPDGDVKIAADDDADEAPNTADNDAVSTDSKKSPYSSRNLNHAPDTNADNAASPNSLIDSKIKPKIDPRSMTKLKK